MPAFHPSTNLAYATACPTWQEIGAGWEVDAENKSWLFKYWLMSNMST